MSDNIIVRWESEDGWHDGVLMCVIETMCYWAERDDMLNAVRKPFPKSRGIIWDRHRNEKSIVPLAKVRLVGPRCPKCDGEGRIVERINSFGDSHSWPCECQEVQNAR